ncbi:hypothetical protein LWI29_027024 [Acer saccharum]|uniref:Dirigent protein n=1 Tax=Acer saccharum TaxID=4024 RepID=A0AA39SF48_ACESA|nr:hypothetical protein LWI29_027024 [Acer saccharum]
MQPRSRLACGNQKKPSSAVEFGTIFAIDDKLTVTSDPNSAPLGRAQGIYVNSAQDSNDPALHLIFSVMFTNKEFNDSTLEIQGADKLFELKNRGFCGVWNWEISARLARGFTVIETAMPFTRSLLMFFTIDLCFASSLYMKY